MPVTQADALISFHKVSNLRGALDLACIYGGVFGSTILASHLQNPFVTVAAIIFIGGLQNALVSLQHDAWHHLCFRPHKLNDIICPWLTGYAVGSSYHFNQVRHSGHHAYFGSERDPDRVTFVNNGKETPAQVIKYFVYILMGGNIVERLRLIFAKDKSLPGMDLRPRHLPSATRELVSIAVSQMVLVTLFALTGQWWNYFIYWLLPLLTIAAFLTTSRQFIEHAHDTVDPSPEERLYDFDANLVEQFFFSPAHFHHHAFHHAYPKIPHYRLTEARDHARTSGILYPVRIRPGYIESFVQHLRALQRKRFATKMEVSP